MDDLILEKNLKETLNKKSEEIGGSLADQRIRTRVFEAIEEEKNMKHRNWKKQQLQQPPSVSWDHDCRCRRASGVYHVWNAAAMRS